MGYYKFFTINEPGKPETVQVFNTIAAARIHAKRNARKHWTEYAIFGHVSSSKSELIERHSCSHLDGMHLHKMRNVRGEIVK